jgi:hypothetical protein
LLQGVEHVGDGSTDGRRDERHVDLFASDRSEVENVDVVGWHPVEPVGDELGERAAARAVASELLEEQRVPTGLSHGVAGIELTADGVDHAGRRAHADPGQRDDFDRRHSGEPAEERPERVVNERPLVASGHEQHQWSESADPGEVHDDVSGRCRRPVQVLDHEEQLVGGRSPLP